MYHCRIAGQVNTYVPGQVVVSLAAIRANAQRIGELAGGVGWMAVVKANAYGHGLVPVAKAAMKGGASYLGAAQIGEALQLAKALGPNRPPILAWLYPHQAPLAEAVETGIELSAASTQTLEQIIAAARQTGKTATVHLKLDTGLGRSGAPREQWEALVRTALAAEAEGAIRALGIWSHFAYADSPGHPTVLDQEAAFADGLALANRLGARFELNHLANSAALLTGRPVKYNLVRPGLALYGLSPIPDQASASDLGLMPAMRLEAELTMVKALPAGHGVSYGHIYHTPTDTVTGLVSLGYADGIPRSAGGKVQVLVGDRLVPQVGRICMDQFAVDLGPGATEAEGAKVVLFGSGAKGEPTAEDWAKAAGTISYEIVTRIPPHVPRHYTESLD
ncbi:MAG: alanine racemase [Micrococcales bacterium]|nr:alanine racemase [Micrococcales bacterium]